jgi:hypothetical protein
MRAPSRSLAGLRGAAGNVVGKQLAAAYSPNRRALQQFDADGCQLPDRRALLIVGAPRRAVPSWYSLAVDRWGQS